MTSYQRFSPARVWALTMSTVTQLVRMRILVFLLVISVVVVAASFAFPAFNAEHRTLYTILAKPVPRLDYLLGKLFGVLIVIVGGLFLLDVVLSGVLWIKQGVVLADALAGLHQQLGATPPPEAVAATTADVMKQGLTWTLHMGVLAIFLKAAVLTSLTLLISCIATSTLFTVITSFCFFIVGHGET